MLSAPKLVESSSHDTTGLRKVLLLGTPSRLRSAQRVLHAVCSDVAAAKCMADIPTGELYDLVVADCASLGPQETRTLIEEYGDLRLRGRLALQIDELDDTQVSALFNAGVEHLTTSESESALGDLRATARKMATADLFGADKYLGWGGRQWSTQVRSSREKAEVLTLCGEVGEALALGVRRAEQLEILAEELITNALYNAPRDGDHNRHRSKPRTDAIELHRREVVDVTLSTDGERLALSVVDPFGSLARETATEYLGRCVARDRDTAREGAGGAGLGLYYAYKSASSLVVNVERSHRTEVIGFIDLHGAAGRIDRVAHSFHLFVR